MQQQLNTRPQQYQQQQLPRMLMGQMPFSQSMDIFTGQNQDESESDEDNDQILKAIEKQTVILENLSLAIKGDREQKAKSEYRQLKQKLNHMEQKLSLQELQMQTAKMMGMQGNYSSQDYQGRFLPSIGRQQWGYPGARQPHSFGEPGFMPRGRNMDGIHDLNDLDDISGSLMKDDFLSAKKKPKKKKKKKKSKKHDSSDDDDSDDDDEQDSDDNDGSDSDAPKKKKKKKKK